MIAIVSNSAPPPGTSVLKSVMGVSCLNSRSQTAFLELFAITSWLVMLAFSPSANASTAFGTLNNFDCVNDTGVEAHGFEIELDDIRSTDITYTYDYNHYGIPKITQDNTDPLHPKVFIRYAATRLPDGTWSAFTAIPSGPITPTDGHQFTNPSVNFGGEHFGAGYYGTPTAVNYNWLIDDLTANHNLIHGPPVYVATPTFTYYPPAPLQPLPQVQAVIVPPPPPAPPVLQFGVATWVKDIKTTTHNANKVELVDLVDPDPEDPAARDWANGEPAEVETEWRILQTEFADPGNPKGELAGVPEDLPDGDEVITRRYEFYKYIGPIDAESGEAMGDTVAADGIHGVGTVTYIEGFDGNGEPIEVTVDLSTVEIVGEFFGAQMSGFDIAPALGLIDHIPDGELGVTYADRTVVVAGDTPFHATTSGSLPNGTTLGEFTGIFSGTPTLAGVFTFTVDAKDLLTDALLESKTYTVTIPEVAPAASTISTSASPVAGGTTSGGGTFENGTQVTVVATHGPGYGFLNWTENGVVVSSTVVYPFTVNADRILVANFIPACTITTNASPGAGGTTSGDGIFNTGDSVTVTATANPGYAFVNWTEGIAVVSSSASYAFTAGA
ncbi:MAG: putative Ig domain-containing protein, partial [Verrucomicrobiota bacterium]